MGEENNEAVTAEYDWARHRSFVGRHVRHLPSPYQDSAPNHLTLLLFAVGSLELLPPPPDDTADDTGAADGAECWARRGVDTAALANYVYGLQRADGGFEGYPGVGAASVANTYAALALLVTIGDDLTRVDRPALAAFLARLQAAAGNGGFLSADLGGADARAEDGDLRFVYSACASAALAGAWDGVDRAAAAAHIHRCRTHDGAFAQMPGQEAHAGSTYCAVAALALLGRLDALPGRAALVRWLALRQTTGFAGRVGKKPDACYAFWCGAALTLLGAYDDVVHRPRLAGFLQTCQAPHGGFCKDPEAHPDIMHTYCTLAGLSLLGTLAPLHPALNISARTAALAGYPSVYPSD